MKTRRRAMLVALAAALLPLRARAQQHKLGFLYAGDPLTLKRFRASVIEGLAERGYQAGVHYELHERFAERRAERLPALVEELLKLQPDLLLTQGTPAALAAARATSSVPIVSITSGELRQSANLTGLTILGSEAAVKQMELLHELVPGVKRIGLMGSRAYPPDKLSF